MQIMRDGFKESTDPRVYNPTGKEPGFTSERAEDALWMLAQHVEEKLGPEGATMNEIYRYVTSPLGLSLDDTRLLVKKAVKGGYLR